MRMRSFRIDDPLDVHGTRAIEVTVMMEDGSQRWCFFMTPHLLGTVGNWVEGTDVRMHPGVPHMIVVSRLDEDVIARVLHGLDREGSLMEHTKPYADHPPH